MISEMGIKAMIVVAALLIGIGSRYIPNFKDDNVIEEAAETVLKHEIKIDVDLSPSSPEK